MAYSTIDKSTDYFNTVTYTGTGSNQTISNTFQSDMIWVKGRNYAYNHSIQDAVRGFSANKVIYPNLTNVEGHYSDTGYIQSVASNNFVVGTGTHSDDANYNDNGSTYVAWNWKANGASPAITYAVKVVSDSGNKYRFDDFGTSAVTLDLQEGGTYTFDQSDSSNAGHPLRFSTTSDGHHNGGSEYTTGVTTTGTPGSSGAKTVITVAASAPTLYYHCHVHSGMGGQANTNSTFGSSNFSGSIQSTVSANTTAGFSIVSFNQASSPQTIGHGLNSVPKIIFIKDRDSVANWQVYSESIGASNKLLLDSTNASASSGVFNSTAPTSSVFTFNSNFGSTIAYCFAEKTGYSKFGSYLGNGNADGTFVYTGFKPAFVMIKQTNTTGNWALSDNKRNNTGGGNFVSHTLAANLSNDESYFGGGAGNKQDYLSNGFKIRDTGGYANTSGGTYIYMAFGQTIVGSNNVPATAR